MQVQFKLINPNACGQSPIEKYETIKEFKNYLNHALYYSGEVYLNDGFEMIKYSETNDIASIVSGCNYYNNILEVIPTFE